MMNFDFSNLLKQTKDNLGIKEVKKTEDEIQFEEEEDAYNANINGEDDDEDLPLAFIKYPADAIDIFNPEQREILDNQYNNLVFSKNTVNSSGMVTDIKEFQITTMNIFFRLNCTNIDMDILKQHICSQCNILECKGNMCEEYTPTNKNDINKYKSTITVSNDGYTETIPMKIPKQFATQHAYNQHTCYVQIPDKRVIPGYKKLIQIKKKRLIVFRPSNVKIFKDGSITILGTKSFNHSLYIAKNILNELNRINKKNPGFLSFEKKEPKDATKKTKIKDKTRSNSNESVTSNSSSNTTDTTTTTDTEDTATTENSSENANIDEDKTIDLSIVPKKKRKLKKVRLCRREDGSKNFKIHLLNATYYINLRINRSKLHKIMITKYNVYPEQCEFKPDNHSAVIIKFNWNLDNKYNGKFGLCCCTRRCVGKGPGATGRGNSHCKIISIKVFESGSISFMGAGSLEQLNDCYHFINSILDAEYHNIRMEPKKLKQKRSATKAPKKRITIKRHQIKNIGTYNKLRVTNI